MDGNKTRMSEAVDEGETGGGGGGGGRPSSPLLPVMEGFPGACWWCRFLSFMWFLSPRDTRKHPSIFAHFLYDTKLLRRSRDKTTPDPETGERRFVCSHSVTTTAVDQLTHEFSPSSQLSLRRRIDYSDQIKAVSIHSK